jgi:hypothetical protein
VGAAEAVVLAGARSRRQAPHRWRRRLLRLRACPLLDHWMRALRYPRLQERRWRRRQAPGPGACSNQKAKTRQLMLAPRKSQTA